MLSVASRHEFDAVVDSDDPADLAYIEEELDRLDAMDETPEVTARLG